MTHTVAKISTHPGPAGRPQPISFLDGTLWVGCWDTSHLYAIDPKTWTVQQEIALPGKPYGVAAFEGALRVVVSIGEEDDRYIYRVVPGEAVSEAGRVACPDLTGSHLSSDGTSLYLVQQGFGRLLELHADGTSKREVKLHSRCAGMGFASGAFYLICADDEFDVLELASFDLANPTHAPERLAPMDVEARGLAFDGATWWTALREKNEIVNFSF